MSLIVLAFALPIVILAVLTAIELFMYFRAAYVVQRAAAEAADAMVSALPGDVSGGTSFISNSITAGTNVAAASNSGYEFYWQRNGGGLTGADVATLPFSLCRGSGCGTDYGSGVLSAQDPGVQYLPMVSVYTCLEPNNETAHNLTNCSSTYNPLMKGFLTYQYPAKLDFDGDGVEDLTFFYPNAGDDWHVILSSSGAMFRDSLRVNLGEAPGAGQRPALPCPADYDGDGKTDFCVVSEDTDTGGMGWSDPPIAGFYLHLMLSTQNYTKYTIGPNGAASGAHLKLPVPGKWNTGAGVGTKDRFAYVALEFATAALNTASNSSFGTYVHAAMTAPTNPISIPTMAAANSFTTYKDKPSTGRYWRPCHSDVDGNGALDICWAEWEGGYPTALVGGDGTVDGSDDTQGQAATSTNFIPWALYYPKTPNAKGLYFTSRNTHQVMLITDGDDNILRGNGDNEKFYLIPNGRWCFFSGGPCPDTTFSTDPMSKLNYDCGTMGGNACSGISPPVFDNPTAVATLGEIGSPLYIADYGTSTIKIITPEGGGYVDGVGAEGFPTNIVGGGKYNNAACGTNLNNTCTAPCGNGTGVGTAAQANGVSCPWKCFVGFGANGTQYHPSCISVKPLSLEVVKDNNGGTAGDQSAIFVGDGDCAIFVVHQNGGAWDPSNCNACPNAGGCCDDTIERIGGTTTCGHAAPTGVGANQTAIGLPTSLALRLTSTGTINGLYVASRSNFSGGEVSGGVFRITPGTDNDFRSGGSRLDDLAVNLISNYAATVNRAPNWTTPATGQPIRNPTALAVASFNNTGTAANLIDPYSSSTAGGLFVAGWWINDGTATTPYENSITHYYASPLNASYGPVGRWLNNFHVNSWGRLAPNHNNDNYTSLTFSTARPLATLPLEASAGLALSHDNRYLYVSETQKGKIYSIFLDQDGDDLSDYGQTACSGNCVTTLFDLDPDGDGVVNDTEDNASTNDPFFPEPSGAGSPRQQDALQDLVIWAKPTTGTMDLPAGTDPDRIEFVVDRFAAVQTAATPSGGDPEQEQAPFTVLGPNTVVMMTPRAAFHSPTVYGAVTRPTECADATLTAAPCTANSKNYWLSPVVMAKRTPAESELKDVSGQINCGANPVGANTWFFNESGNYVTGGLDVNGAMISSCHTATMLPYAAGDGRRIGAIRVNLSHWSSQWYPAGMGTGREISVLDRDGVDGRNPVVYNPGSSVFLMAHVGNLDSTKTGSNCPGYYAGPYLAQLEGGLRTKLSWGAFGTYEKQFGCYNTGGSDRFFSLNGTQGIISTMVDHHAEYYNFTYSTSVAQGATTGTRFGASGPVIGTAYKIIEDSLPLGAKGATVNPYDYKVTVVPKTVTGSTADDQLVACTVKVQYVFPLLPGLSSIFGGATYTITREESRLPYNFGRTNASNCSY